MPRSTAARSANCGEPYCPGSSNQAFVTLHHWCQHERRHVIFGVCRHGGDYKRACGQPWSAVGAFVCLPQHSSTAVFGGRCRGYTWHHSRGSPLDTLKASKPVYGGDMRGDSTKNRVVEGKRMASGDTGNVVPRKGLWVRVPCPPLTVTTHESQAAANRAARMAMSPDDRIDAVERLRLDAGRFLYDHPCRLRSLLAVAGRTSR